MTRHYSVYLRRLLTLAAVVVALVLSSGAQPALATHAGQEHYWKVVGSRYVAHLQAVDDDSATGHLTLSDNGDGTTTVEIVLDKPTRLGTQANDTSLHQGTATEYDPDPVVRLEDLVNGASTTKVAIPITEMRARIGIFRIETLSGDVLYACIWSDDE